MIGLPVHLIRVRVAGSPPPRQYRKQCGVPIGRSAGQAGRTSQELCCLHGRKQQLDRRQGGLPNTRMTNVFFQSRGRIQTV